MGLDINSLRDFIPFGSAMLGAVTGGFITYSMSRATQRKEKRLKGLQSISELKLLIYEISNDAIDLQGKLEAELKRDELFGSDENLKAIVIKTKEFFNNLLTGKWTDFYIKAVHISKEVFLETRTKYKKLLDLQGELMRAGIKIKKNGVKLYLKEVIDIVNSSFELLSELGAFLEKKEGNLIEEYMNKYINEKSTYFHE
ncbi:MULTISPECIES: hypothetical protein [Bacillus]|uniref:hypothetical protein n=1 Tax=Bacillus TaxID=1386 RepID=UPI00094D20DD|nr:MULTISPECIES: hypothetical protein [Bacillus]MEC0900966.1 hypothetical protein [Bacillus anthracis]WHT92038.1 hypothetical protein QM226_002306 [Bacillus cereus]